MYDALFLLQDTVTKTATYTGTGLDLKTGTQRRGFKVRLRVPTVSGTSPTLDITVQHSTDNTTYTDLVTFAQVTAAAELFRTVETVQRYIRAKGVISGTLPSFILTMEMGLARP